MRVERVRPPFEAVVVRDTYTRSELSEIYQELDFLTNARVMRPPLESGSALDEYGNPTKKNKAVFLYETYFNESTFPILIHTQKLFDRSVSDALTAINPVHEVFTKINRHSTLLSYYEDADKYDFHRDECLYTSVTYLFREPKSFSGGDISFKVEDDIETFEIENNMSIVLPSIYHHGVSPVVMSGKRSEFSGMGRYCISQFMNFVPR